MTPPEGGAAPRAGAGSGRLRFASLGSGSSGNGLVAEAGRSRLLLDCGFSVRDTTARLARIGLEPADLSGIIVTHEHDDHVGGVFGFARRHRVPVWMTHGTLTAARGADAGVQAGVEINRVRGGERFAIGDLEVLPYTVPHDAREPVQYVISNGAWRLGVLTDTGCSTPHIEAALSACQAIVLEANHDLGMLQNGDYPPALKARISGRLGHLDNGSAAALLGAIAHAGLRHVVAAHLSESNNTPEFARAAFAAALGCDPGWIGVASQAEGFDWRELA